MRWFSPLPDHPYKSCHVPWRLRDVVQIQSVLVPLLGPYMRRQDIPDHMVWLRAKWRKAAYRLKLKGWAPTKTRYKPMKRCPMTFAVTGSRWRACRVSTACPFCWARNAAATWEKIDRAFFGPPPAPTLSGGRHGRAIEAGAAPAADASDGPIRRRAAGKVLVVRTYPFDVDFYKPPIVGDEPCDCLKAAYWPRVRGSDPYTGVDYRWFRRGPDIQSVLKRAPGPPGGCYEGFTARLAADRGHWRCEMRQVWMLPPGVDVPVIATPTGVPLPARTKVVHEPWRHQVMKAVALACRYPRAMFQGGDYAYQLVTSRDGLRLSASYGAFRKAHGRD
jgi:hypothetical protein